MGKAPSDMFFESEVRLEYEGRLLLDSLCDRFTYHSREDWIDRLTRGLVTINGATANVETVAHRGDKVVYHVENYSEPEVPTDFETVFEDDEFILVAKPAGVPVHHTGRIFYNTFAAIIRREFDSETATPMHRLDRDTGGLILFARYGETAARFQKNLDRILLRKFYLAVVRGKFPEGEVECHMPLREDPEDPIRLRMHHREGGKECFTRFKLVRHLDCPEIAPELSLVEAELITGRKHQIRAHLAEMGLPRLWGTACITAMVNFTRNSRRVENSPTKISRFLELTTRCFLRTRLNSSSRTGKNPAPSKATHTPQTWQNSSQNNAKTRKNAFFAPFLHKN